MYAFLTGPMLWIALLVFFGGLAYRIVTYIRGLDWKLDRVAYSQYRAHGLKHAARSIGYFLVPYATHCWRNQPYMTFFTFLFHLAVVLIPIFGAAHTTLWREWLGLPLPSLPGGVTQFLVWGFIISFAFLVLRRLALPQVRILTTKHDWFILGLTGLAFISGALAAWGFSYDFWLLTHIFVVEVLLILTPFTKLSHMALFFMSRGQLGMDFGIKRGGMKKGNKGFAW
jgi:nitrate reductase gamma subunit